MFTRLSIRIWKYDALSFIRIAQQERKKHRARGRESGKERGAERVRISSVYG